MLQLICMISHAVAASVLFATAGEESEASLRIDGRDVVQLQLFYALGFFSAVTAMTHFGYILDPRLQKYRMFEYAITAPVMGVCIAILCDIREIYALAGIFGLLSTTMLFGFLQEQSGPEDQNEASPFVLGFVPYSIAIGLITAGFSRAARASAGDIPEFVYAVFIIEIVFLFSGFAVVQFLYDYLPKQRGQLPNVKEANFYYHVLSLVSKQALVWVTFAGLRSTTR